MIRVAQTRAFGPGQSRKDFRLEIVDFELNSLHLVLQKNQQPAIDKLQSEIIGTPADSRKRETSPKPPLGAAQNEVLWAWIRYSFICGAERFQGRLELGPKKA